MTPIQNATRNHYRIKVREHWELWKFSANESIRKEAEINYLQTVKILNKLEGRK